MIQSDFSSLPFETIIHDTQQDYYAAISASDKLGPSTPFIAYMLGVIDEGLQGLTKDTAPVLTESDRIQYFLSLKNDGLDIRFHSTGVQAEPNVG